MLRDQVDELTEAGLVSEDLPKAQELLGTLPGAVYAGSVSAEEGRLQVLDALLRLR